jgi:hypothetical protein
MSNPDPASAGTRSYNYSIRSLGSKTPAEIRPLSLFGPACLAMLVPFLLLGILLLPMTGFQTDEVMFVYDLWHPEAALSKLGLHGHSLPTMMMPYLGALKSWLYVPVFGILGYSPYAVRIPMLLLAAVTIFLTGVLLRRIAGPMPALIGVALLSTDVVFLVTSVFDWGPVVIQNFLLVLGLLFALSWYRTGRNRYAFLLGLCYGLAFWNKALFVWNLSGLVLALLCFALPSVIRVWRWKAAALAAIGLLIGAMPLIKFNLQSRGSTLESTSHVSWSAIGDKAWYLTFALNGEAAPTANVDLASPNPDKVHHPLSAAAATIAAKLGPTPSSWRFPVCTAAILFALLIANNTGRKWIGFFLVSGFIGWLESAFTLDAGRSIHHTVLFWINWYAATALAFGYIAAWRPRPARSSVAVLTAVLALFGIATIVADYGDLAGHSATTPWTDADAALAAKLSSLGANSALTADWGIADVLALRARDRIAVTQEEFNLNGGSFDRDVFADCKAPNCYVVTHVPDKLMLPKAGSTLSTSFAARGFTQNTEATISDTHGTPTFLILAAATSASPQPAQALPPATASNVPKLLATPDVIIASGEVGRTTLTWQVPAAMAVEIHVGAPDGPLFASGIGPGQEATGFWVKNGTQFFLQDVTGGKSRSAENTIARITVAVRRQ